MNGVFIHDGHSSHVNYIIIGVGKFALLCALTSVAAQTSDSIELHSTYKNLAGYAFEATVPSGFIGHRDAAPAPNHGFAIDLSRDGDARIWVDGSYNVLFVHSARAAAEKSSSWIRERGDIIGSPQFLASRLAGLKAAQMTVRYRDRKAGVARVYRAVAAISEWSPEPGGIVYTVCLDTLAERLAIDEPIWQRVLTSFELLKQ